jgi:hypothetical protein
MSPEYQSADLIMKLYELRREDKMRQARDWFLRFFPESTQDVIDAIAGPNSSYYRMVTTYWDMASSFVNRGAIDEQMFTDANAEHIAVFCKIEPYIEEFRSIMKSPQYLHSLEELVMRLPEARARLRATRERLKKMIGAQAAKAEQGEQ